VGIAATSYLGAEAIDQRREFLPEIRIPDPVPEGSIGRDPVSPWNGRESAYKGGARVGGRHRFRAPCPRSRPVGLQDIAAIDLEGIGGLKNLPAANPGFGVKFIQEGRQFLRAPGLQRHAGDEMHEAVDPSLIPSQPMLGHSRTREDCLVDAILVHGATPSPAIEEDELHDFPCHDFPLTIFAARNMLSGHEMMAKSRNQELTEPKNRRSCAGRQEL